MQTGYDNFWMYQNSRHEPVHLQKNDNCIYPVLTDSYKQMQNGGYPSIATIAPLNNVVSSCQDGQYKTGLQCMWSSSVYSQPYNSSYANNLHPQMFPTQTNNFSYLSQSSQNQQQSCVKNPVVNICVQNKASKKQVSTKLHPNNNCTETEIARIRVKDVFTLNNTSICSTLLDSSQVHTQKNKEYEYFMNCAAKNCNRTCDFETNLPVSNSHSSLNVQPEQSYLNNQQQFLQHSGPFYQQNAQLLTGNQYQSNVNTQMGNNSQLEGFKTQPLKKNFEKEFQSNSCNVLNENKKETNKPKRKTQLSYSEAFNSHSNTESSNKINYHDLQKANEPSDNANINTFPHTSIQNQVNFLNNKGNSYAPTLARNSAVEDLRKKEKKQTPNTSLVTNTKSFPKSKPTESNSVKITFSHTDQTVSVNSKSSYPDKNSNLSLPSLLESSNEILRDALNKKNPQNYVQDSSAKPSTDQTSRTNCSTSYSRNEACTKSLHSLQDDLKSKTRNSDCTYYRGKMTSPKNQFSSQNIQSKTTINLTYQEDQKAFLNSNNLSEGALEKSCSKTSDADKNIRELIEPSYTYYKSKMSPSRNQISYQSFQPEPVNNLTYQEDQKAFLHSNKSPESSLENFSSKTCDSDKNREFIEQSYKTALISNYETSVNDVTVKQEMPDLEESSANILCDQNIAIGQVVDRIKTEENQEILTTFESEQEFHPSENQDLGEDVSSDTDVSENININVVEEDIFVSKKIDSKLVTMPSDVEIIENSIRVSESCRSSEGKNNVGSKVANQEINLETAKACITEKNYESKINRDKLDLLIQFLKKDEITVESNSSEGSDQTIWIDDIRDESQKKQEISLTRNRRKLSKTCIVKNKNNSREMVSLMSHKIPRTEISHTLPKYLESEKANESPSKEEERKNDYSITVIKHEKCDDDFENQQSSFDPSQEVERQKNNESKSETRISNESGNQKNNKSSVAEENNIINIMQALQNLKSHFCMSCTLVSSIDLFWVNVVSGELRCLNCFKKMTSKTDENVLNFNTACDDDRNSAEAKLLLEGNIQKENENEEITIEMICDKPKSEFNNENSNNPKLNIETREPINELAKDKIACLSNGKKGFTSKCQEREIKGTTQTANMCRKKYIESEEKSENSETSEENFTPKTDILEVCPEQDSEIIIQKKWFTERNFVFDRTQSSEKKESSLKSRKRSNSEESHISTLNYSEQLDEYLEKNSLQEKNISPKTKVHFVEDFKKEKKLTSQSVEKRIPKEQHVLLTSQVSKESVEQETNGYSEKSIKQGLSKEDDISDIGRKEKKQTKDPSQGKKRINSKEDFGFHKSRTSSPEKAMSTFAFKSTSKESFDSYKSRTPERTPKKNTNDTPLTSPSDKSVIHDFNKDTYSNQRTKMLKRTKARGLSEVLDKKNMCEYKNVEKEKTTELLDQLRKRRKSVEECIPHKVRAVEEHSRNVKFTKHSFEKSRAINSSKSEELGFKTKTSEHSKHVTADLIAAPQKKSRDERFYSKEQSKSGMKYLTELPDKPRKNSISKENLSSFSTQTSECLTEEKNYESYFIDSNEKERKQFFAKTPKTSRKNSEEIYEDMKFSSNDKKHQKSKPLKESQKSETKSTSTTQKVKKKELHEDRHHKHREQIVEKPTEKKKNERPTNTKTVAEVGNYFDKKNLFSREISKAQSCNKSSFGDTEKPEKNVIRRSKKVRALECVFGRKKDDLKEVRKISLEQSSSNKLLEKLIDRTKRLSWGLLSEN